ncbi:type II toxin-antitoxin system VapB family antitoxin [Rhizobium leguminosarum]|uniref:type II toxin-antitoxin system VapB family antitoxin n=1 Tax=Rhizobium leguminosarum TaxID=384 RepID=UPI003B5886CB
MAHSASLHSKENNAPSNAGTKHLVRQALETLVRVESGKRLIALGGTMPDAEAAPRRRSAAAK